MREFYANPTVVNLSDPVIRIRGKVVHFGYDEINMVYANMSLFEAKNYAPGSW